MRNAAFYLSRRVRKIFRVFTFLAKHIEKDHCFSNKVIFPALVLVPDFDVDLDREAGAFWKLHGRNGVPFPRCVFGVGQAGCFDSNGRVFVVDQLNIGVRLIAIGFENKAFQSDLCHVHVQTHHPGPHGFCGFCCRRFGWLKVLRCPIGKVLGNLSHRSLLVRTPVPDPHVVHQGNTETCHIKLPFRVPFSTVNRTPQTVSDTEMPGHATCSALSRDRTRAASSCVCRSGGVVRSCTGRCVCSYACAVLSGLKVSTHG